MDRNVEYGEGRVPNVWIVSRSTSRARQPVESPQENLRSAVTSIPDLPRLVYIGDVPVEASVAGAALLYRLLADYPPDRLAVVHCARPHVRGPRLPGVLYGNVEFPPDRLVHSRFAEWAGLARFLAAPRQARQVSRLVAPLRPEAVLTVAHGYGWVTAAHFARKNDLPLHLVVHDHVPDTLPAPAWFRDRLSRKFEDVYLRASSRFCISPNMAREYGKLGRPASVLYPSRSRDLTEFDGIPEPQRAAPGALVFAYAGSINTPTYASMLSRLAAAIEPSGSRILLFTKEGHEGSFRQNRNVEFREFVPSRKLILTLREEADVVVVPMSFDSSDRTNMELSFPSKLTDYTATGLPLLIWGPEYCSAVCWARQYAQAAEVVTSESTAALDAALNRLRDAQYRRLLGQVALDVGKTLFLAEAAAKMFFAALSPR